MIFVLKRSLCSEENRVFLEAGKTEWGNQAAAAVIVRVREAGGLEQGGGCGCGFRVGFEGRTSRTS